MRPATYRAKPEHFDSTKYDENGNRVGARPGPASKMTIEQAEQIVFLDQLVRTAKKDLSDYLASLGIEDPKKQSDWVSRLRNGWRPR